MRVAVCAAVVLGICALVRSEIKNSPFLNKLVKPVGGPARSKFVPLTEIPPPHKAHPGRRHMEDCTPKEEGRLVAEGGKVDIFGEYYDDRVEKTVVTVVMPDHIDRRHFEITSPIPYLTVGTIEAMGYHPTTMKSDHPSECEKLYQDHLDGQYSDETEEYSDESLEMARMPMMDGLDPPPDINDKLEEMYSDV